MRVPTIVTVVAKAGGREYPKPRMAPEKTSKGTHMKYKRIME